MKKKKERQKKEKKREKERKKRGVFKKMGNRRGSRSSKNTQGPAASAFFQKSKRAVRAGALGRRLFVHCFTLFAVFCSII